jgi:hypothetical protein
MKILAPAFLLLGFLASPIARANDALPPPAELPPNHAIELLLRLDPGAPTAEDLVEYSARPDGAPPLDAFAAIPPDSVVYAMPMRAEGDFREWLDANPESPRARLERYLIVHYAEPIDLRLVLEALRADRYVEWAQEPIPLHFSSAELIDFGVGTSQGTDGLYGRAALNIDAAWAITGGGHALVQIIDSGLATQHAQLRQFDVAGNYVGGNFVPVASLDIGGSLLKNNPVPPDACVDEREPMDFPTCPDDGLVVNLPPPCRADGAHMVSPDYSVGHGTHTSGLLAANGAAGTVQGTCKACGIALWKTLYTGCVAGTVTQNYDASANAASLGYSGDIGAQVASLSFGSNAIGDGYCQTPFGAASLMCTNIEYARERDVAIVAASGNWRADLQFPANDDRVIAAGGFQQDLTLWDNQPTFPPGQECHECGSNWTVPISQAKQELMASAKTVLSTTYAGFDWNPLYHCTDDFGGTGYCTGTSMSTPQVAAVVALVRSVNPLAPVGQPTFNPNIDPYRSLRWVIASTTWQAQHNQGWSPTMGYGRPDAAAASRKMLGKVAGGWARNRATPLFRMYSSTTVDYADTTSPQAAVALMINQKNAWQPALNAAPVPNPAVNPPYYTFPKAGTPAVAKANVYVMTTNLKPRAEWPDLIPLYLMDKDFPSGRDFMLVTTVADIEAAHDNGYSLRTIQGYIFAPCAPEATCKPPGTERLLRKCTPALERDCATFLQVESGSFSGYTATYPGATSLLGYAYPATDTDGDGLPDGFEYVVGTSHTMANSDGDVSPDASELPMVGVPITDPCSGTTGALNCPGEHIFANGFDI